MKNFDSSINNWTEQLELFKELLEKAQEGNRKFFLQRPLFSKKTLQKFFKLVFISENKETEATYYENKVEQYQAVIVKWRQRRIEYTNHHQACILRFEMKMDAL